MQNQINDCNKEDYVEELVNSVVADYLNRRKNRASIERQWELNLKFMEGKQYCDISPKGEIFELDKEYYWQSRDVFNHISPLVEARLNKLSLVLLGFSFIISSLAVSKDRAIS